MHIIMARFVPESNRNRKWETVRSREYKSGTVRTREIVGLFEKPGVYITVEVYLSV